MGTPVKLGLIAVALGAAAIGVRILFTTGGAVAPPLPADLERLDAATAGSVREAHARIVRAPKDAAAWGELGLVYEANELQELADPCFAEASRLAPAEVRWAYRRGRVLTKLGRIPEAIEALERASSIDPRVSTVHWQLGLLRLSAGDLDLAERDFARATAANPKDAAGWIGLARVHLQRERAEPAIEALQRALALRDDGYAHLLLGRAYQLADRAEDSRSEFARGKDAQPYWPDPFADEMLRRRVGFSVTLDRARALIFSNQAPSAIHLLERLRREHPRDPSVINNLADAYSGAGRPQDARALLEEGLANEPSSCTMRVNLAVLRFREGDVAAALAEIERALAIDPAQPMAHELKGHYLFAQRRYDDALSAYRDALAFDGRKVDVRIAIGETLMALKRPAEAAEAFAEARRIDPQRVAALAELERRRTAEDRR